MASTRALYRLLRRQDASAMPADLFLHAAVNQRVPLARALEPRAQLQLLRRAFADSRDPPRDLDTAVQCAGYCSKREQALRGCSEARTAWPLLVLEDPVLPTETVEWIFVEPRYLQMAREALAGTRRFVYLSSAAFRQLGGPGRSAVGVLCYIMKHEQRDSRVFAQCVAGPPTVVRGVEARPLESPVGPGEVAEMAWASVQPSPELEWQEQPNAEQAARAALCRHALAQAAEKQAPTVRGWVARCGVPPGEVGPFSFWLAGALAHQQPAEVRQKLLDCGVTERLELLLPTLKSAIA